MQSSSAAVEPERIRNANIRYHDVAASGYDEKWGIDYGEVGRGQVLQKLRKALGAEPGHFPRALEIGAGTGYFSLNLIGAGVIERAVATDISTGMLAQLTRTAQELGVEIETVQCEAEHLPFADESFDVVLGHAVLHHVPGLERALSEFMRILAPGGAIVFMGEPSRHGNRMAAVPKRLGIAARPLWRRLLGAREPEHRDASPHDASDHTLERLVDVHTFTASELRLLALRSGFQDVRITGEELLANVFGWFLRSIEADSDPHSVPRAWHKAAFRAYLALQRVDTGLLEPHLPPELFYNLLLSARKPAQV